MFSRYDARASLHVRRNMKKRKVSPNVMKLLKAKEVSGRVHFAYLLGYNHVEVYDTAR